MKPHSTDASELSQHLHFTQRRNQLFQSVEYGLGSGRRHCNPHPEWSLGEKSSPILDYKRRAWSWSQFLGSQPAGDISYKPGGRLPLLSTRPAVSPQNFQNLTSKSVHFSAFLARGRQPFSASVVSKHVEKWFWR